MEPPQRYFEEAIYFLDVAERLYSQNLKIFENQKVISVITQNLAKSLRASIRGILWKEFSTGKFQFKKTPKKNFSAFILEVSPRYFSDEERAVMKSIFNFESKYKVSPISYAQKDKLIIMSHGNFESFDLKNMEKMLKLAQKSARICLI